MDDLSLAAALADPETHPGGLSVSVVVPSPSAIRHTVEAGMDDRLALVGLELKFGVGDPLGRQVECDRSRHSARRDDVRGDAPTDREEWQDGQRCRPRIQVHGGLHRAIRHTDATTGLEHHGYLNILWAATETTRGVDAITSVAERDPAHVVAALREVGPVALTQARSRFLSYGSRSIDEPLADLTALNLVELYRTGQLAARPYQ